MNLYDLLKAKKRNELLNQIKQFDEGEKLYAKMLVRAIINRLKNFGIDGYRPYGVQEEFHKADQFFRVMWGANSSGKTYAGVAETAMHLSGIYPDWYPEYNRYINPVDAWICLEDYDSFEDTHKPYLEHFIGPIIKSYNAQKHIMRLKTGTTLHVKSYRSGVDAFKSSAVPSIYLDEEPSEAILDACRARIVRERGGQIFATITPVTGPQWFFKILERAKDDDSYFATQAKMDDNKSLTEKDKREFAEGIDDERERQVRVEGKAVPLMGSRVFQADAVKAHEKNIEQPMTAKLTWRDEHETEDDFEMTVLNK